MLIEMLKSGEFAALDARLSEYQRGFEAGRLSEDVAKQAFAAFAHSDPALEAMLTRWALEVPDSYAAPLARGIYLANLGWHARGARFSNKTPEARFRQMRNYLTKAARDFRRAILMNEKLSLAYGNLINIGMAASDLVDERAVMEAGLRAVPQSRDIRYRYLRSLEPKWGGSMARIEDFLERVREDAADYPEIEPLLGYADYVRGEALRRKARYAEAAAYFDKALEYGEDWWYRYNRGLNAYFGKDYEDAIEEFGLALALWPESADTLDRRARAYRALDRIELAMADWDAALRLDPHDPLTLRQRARTLRKQGRYREAERDYTDALLFGTLDHRIRYERGWLYLWNLKEYEKAAADLQRATMLEPERASYWYHYASALFRNLDCEFQPAARSYLRLCRDGTQCQAERTEWAEAVLDTFARSSECAMSG